MVGAEMRVIIVFVKAFITSTNFQKKNSMIHLNVTSGKYNYIDLSLGVDSNPHNCDADQ
jgi:hypothetical protein